MSVPLTLFSQTSIGRSTLRATEAMAAWWKTTSAPRTARAQETVMFRSLKNLLGAAAALLLVTAAGAELRVVAIGAGPLVVLAPGLTARLAALSRFSVAPTDE